MKKSIEKIVERCIEREAVLSKVADDGMTKYCFIQPMKDDEKRCKYQEMSSIHYTDKGLRYGCSYRCPYSRMSKRISRYLLDHGGC